LLCGGKLGKDPYFDFHQWAFGRIWFQKFDKVTMEALTIRGGMPRD